MSAQHLLIRNLTSEPIELQHVEIIEERGAAGIAKSSRAWYSPFSSRAASPSPSTTDLASLATQTKRHDINVVIKPFALGKLPHSEGSTRTAITNFIASTARRITLSSAGHRYRLLLSPDNPQSQSLIPLTFEQPARNLSSIYLKTDNCLTIIDSSIQSSSSTWMSNVPDSTPLSLLSIPGTHNSAACYKALPSVRCQVLGVMAQLTAGIRFFDLRVQIANPANPASEVLIMVHSIWSVSMAGTKYFRPVLDAVETFLKQNPSETVVLSLKREGSGQGTDEQLSVLLEKHFTSPEHSLWYTDPIIPTLGQARGKIILVRRFNLHESLLKAHGGRGWGLDAHAWQHNTECDYHGHVCAQDRFDMPEIRYWEKKVDAVVRQLERSHDLLHRHHLHDHRHQGQELGQGQGPESEIDRVDRDGQKEIPPLHLNFASASNFFRSSCWPDRIAAKLNPAVLRYLCLFHGVIHETIKQTSQNSQDTSVEVSIPEHKDLTKRERKPSIVEQPDFAEHLLGDDGRLAGDVVDVVEVGRGSVAVEDDKSSSEAAGSHADNGKTSTAGREINASGSTGILILDWVGADGNWDLINCIIAMNGRLAKQQTDR